jgi:putative chitinase
MASIITYETFRRLVPKIGPDNARAWSAALAAAAEGTGIKSRREVSHWLGQMCHESRGFTVFEEDLWYSAKRITQVWPKRFPTLADALPFAGNPKALANKVYNGRMGNRPDTDDGYYFRGRGPKQLTGRDNYTAFGAWLATLRTDAGDIRLHPQLLANPDIGAMSAAWFWDENNLSAILAHDANDQTASAKITVAINNGTTGQASRWTWTERALSIW